MNDGIFQTMGMNNHSITRLLKEIRQGNSEAYDALFPKVYDQLRNMAAVQLNREHNGHTLRKTALVHEVYMKLVSQSEIVLRDRAHFFAIAARAMRQILVDYARKKKAKKRGGDSRHITLEEEQIDLNRHAEHLIELNDLIDRLAKFDERKSRVVEMRFFAGMTIREIAEYLDVSTRTVDRDWLKARTWLHKELKQA